MFSLAHKILVPTLVLVALGHLSGAELSACHYDAPARALTVALSGADRFRYVFNKGGAINGIFDLQLAPAQNLIGPSFQGETTDRVIQWTYWNRRYEVPSNPVGDHNRRANATMEGCYANAATCDVISTPPSGTGNRLEFRSRLEHWFYANLDEHGKPDFETTSTYQVLDDGSLQLTRRVVRHPWKLTNVSEADWNGSSWVSTPRAATTMVCQQYAHGSQTSYFEAWSPFDRRPLPLQKHGKGSFDADGYRMWKPQDLGGWAMAYGDKQAVGLVFGKTEMGNPDYKLRTAFNKLDLPKANLNVLLPAVETDWPDNKALTQVLIIVPGSPSDVARRAEALVETVPVPTVTDAGPPE